MSRSLAVILWAIVMCGMVLLSVGMTTDPMTTVAPAVGASWTWLIEWLRIVGGILGMVGVMFGIWVYFSVTRKQKTEQALATTMGIYRDEAAALKSKVETMDGDYKVQQAQIAERERELITLRARTDLSEVLKCSQVMTQSLTDLIAEGRKHDSTITTVLKDAVANGQEQYKAVMEMNAKILTHLDDTAKQGLDQTIKNYELIEKLVVSINSLSRRFGGVERAVDKVSDQVGVDAPPEEPIERRKERRAT